MSHCVTLLITHVCICATYYADCRKKSMGYSEDFSNLTVVKSERVKITLQVVYKFYKC